VTRGQRDGLLLTLATAGISGVSIFVNSYGVRAVHDAAVYTTGKNAVSAVVLLALAAGWSLRGRPRLTRPDGPRQWAGLGAIAVIGGSLPFVLFFDGLARESSTQAALLQKTLVIWVSILAVPLLGERLGVLQIGAVALLVVGQVLVSGVGVLRMPFGTGELEILAATLLWAVEVVLAKRLLGTLSSWTVGLARMVAGSVLLIGWLLVRGDLGFTRLGAGAWGWMLLTGVLLAAYVATWFAALARAQAVDVTAVLVVGAPVTALLSAAVQHAPLRPQLVGLVLITAGASIVVARMSRRPDTDERRQRLAPA
jgi:drug/metabolite transporter (DMT)-like permease